MLIQDCGSLFSRLLVFQCIYRHTPACCLDPPEQVAFGNSRAIGGVDQFHRHGLHPIRVYGVGYHEVVPYPHTGVYPAFKAQGRTVASRCPRADTAPFIHQDKRHDPLLPISNSHRVCGYREQLLVFPLLEVLIIVTRQFLLDCHYSWPLVIDLSLQAYRFVEPAQLKILAFPLRQERDCTILP